MNSIVSFFGLVVVATLLRSAGSVTPRPNPELAPVFARWMVNQSSRGVLSTFDISSSAPFGNVHSVVDGGTGTPYFYQSTKMDRTGENTLVVARASFTVSEIALAEGACKDDPQYPACAKLTLIGQLRVIPRNSSEANFWEAVFFAKHPQFKGFPKQMRFEVLKLVVEEVYLVNMLALAVNISLPDYYGAKL